MDGARRVTAAPIKAKENWHYNTVKLLGRPEPIIDAIQRFISPKPDIKARARIFGDNYKPKEKPENEKADSESLAA